MNCDKLFSCIPQTRWAEPCFVVTKKLHDYCIKFLANHFVEFLKSEAWVSGNEYVLRTQFIRPIALTPRFVFRFTSIATNRTWGIVIMDEKTKVACSRMRTDQLCQSYAYISGQCKLATATHDNEVYLLQCNERIQIHLAHVGLCILDVCQNVKVTRVFTFCERVQYVAANLARFVYLRNTSKLCTHVRV